MESKVTLIDLSSLFWQTWHASTDQEMGSAYDGTIHKVYKHVNGADPVAICVDRPPYIRKKYFEEYKIQRDKPSAAAIEQLKRVIETLENDGLPVLGADGYEADDVIATITDSITNVEDPISVTIVSSDKDLAQLVGPHTHTVSPLTGDTYDINAVVEKFGVMPGELGELLALAGDKSDNVPGVPGIGYKTGAKLLNEHGWNTLIELIDVDDPDHKLKPPGVRQKLLDNFDNLQISRKLVELMTDAPVDVDSIFAPRVKKGEKMKPQIERDFESECSNLQESIEALPETPPDAPESPTVDEPLKPMTIVKADPWALRLEPDDTKSAWKLAHLLFESRLYTKFPNPESILAAILRGRALGIDATTALDGFESIKQQLTMKPQLMLGLVLQSGLCDYFKLVESTNEVAEFKTHRKGDPDDEPTVCRFTIEKAKKMGLASKDNWTKQPDTMLRWRCIAELARIVYPDVVSGLYTPEEMGDDSIIDVEVL